MSGPDRLSRLLRCAPLLLLLAGLAAILAPEAESREAPMAGPTTVSCRNLASQRWTDSERWVWNCLCAGVAADFNARPSFGGTLDPRTPNGWKQSRELSPEFLRAILFEKPYRDALPSRGVAIAGALFTGPVDLPDGVLARPVAIEKSRFEKKLVLRRIKTERYLSLQGSFVEDDLDLSFSTFEQVALGGGTFGQLTMAAATVHNQLVLLRTHVRGTANLFSIRTDQSVFLNEATFDKWLLMDRAVIRADLYLRGAAIKYADLSNAAIDGTFWLGPNRRSDGTEQPVRWQDPMSRLILRDARVGPVITTADSGVWPPVLDLNGFRYTRLSFPQERSITSGTKPSDFLAQPVGWFLGWLKKSPFSPQPYEQLAEVLRINGFPDKAKDVLYEGKDEEWWNSRIIDVTSAIDFLLLTLSWLFIGYGHRIYYVGAWILFFLVLGATIFRKTPEVRQAGVPSVAYSFDTLIPLITLHERHKQIDIAGRARIYFYCHRIVGYVLASFVVAGLAGLTK